MAGSAAPFPVGFGAQEACTTWEATAFSVDEAGQTALPKSRLMGVELFVMDDGWFGERANDRAGLGTVVNREISARPGTDCAGQGARHGVRVVGRARDGES